MRWARFREVIDTASRVTRRKVPIDIAPRRPGDPAVLAASSNRIAHDLGWQPRYPQLDAIIESAWRWMGSTGAT